MPSERDSALCANAAARRVSELVSRRDARCDSLVQMRTWLPLVVPLFSCVSDSSSTDYLMGNLLAFKAGGASTMGTTQLQSGTWYHVAATLDAGKLTVYVNGSPEGTPANNGSTQLSNDGVPMRLGATAGQMGWQTPCCFFDGLIDELAVYSKPLSGAQITQAKAGNFVKCQ